jgi:hypothetical protein
MCQLLPTSHVGGKEKWEVRNQAMDGPRAQRSIDTGVCYARMIWQLKCKPVGQENQKDGRYGIQHKA